MEEEMLIDPEESIAAVHKNGKWRFFHDEDYMFILDYGSYDPDYEPKPGQPRYGSLIVNDDTFDTWTQSLSGELTIDEIPHAKWEDGGQVKLTYVIDFDRQLWIGHHWNMDQSPLTEYQPPGWVAIENDVFNYVPSEIRKLWDAQLIKNPMLFSIDGRYSVLISPYTRAGTWGEVSRGIRLPRKEPLRLSIVRLSNGDDSERVVLYQAEIEKLPNVPGKYISLLFRFTLGYKKGATISISFHEFAKRPLIETIAELGPFQLD